MAGMTKQSRFKSLYDADFHRWSEEQAKRLSERRPEGLDWDNLAEEIASLGRSDKREVESRLSILLLHLLKWKYQSSRRNRGWLATLFEQRQRIGKLIRESPSLGSYPKQVLDEEYAIAVTKAAAETGLDESSFPNRCPFSVDDVLDVHYLPED